MQNLINKLKRFSLTLYILMIFLPISFSFSQEQNIDSSKSYILDPVVVTGARYQVNKGKISTSITIVDKKEIEESNNVNVISILDNHVPGLFLDNRNVLGFGIGSNSAGTISMRGIGGNPNTQILVLIDGQPQFMGMFGHPIIDALSSSGVERVEVVRGPGSILYGTNAMGGAINIISKKIPRDKFSANLSSLYGSFNSFNVNGSAGYNNEGFGLYLSFNRTKTAGHREDAEDDFNNSTGFAKISYNLNEQFEFEIDGTLSDAKFYDPGPVFELRENNYYNYLRTRGAFSVFNHLGEWNGALRFYYSYGDHDFYDGWNSYDEMKGITFYQNIRLLKGLIFTAGIDYKNYGGKGENSNIPLPVAAGLGLGIYHSNNEFAVYGLIKDSLFKYLNVEAGLRYTNNTLFDPVYTPQFGFTFSPSFYTIIRGSVGKGFRSPTIVDLYLFPVSNENLEPERILNYEIGIEQRLFNYRLNFAATAFYYEGNNIIVVRPPLFVKNNSGSFIHKGIELHSRYFLAESLNLSLNYSYLHTSQPILYAPKHNLNLQLDYQYNIVQVLLNLKQVTGLYSSTEKNIKQNYFTVGSTVNFSVIDPLKIFIKGENLLDKNYQIDDGYPMPGITIMAGVKLNY